jgi:MoaA/NifB/PqqE/SkfB family radical SAM enzyme
MNGLNQFRLAHRALGAAWSRPSFPYKLTFVATERCNLRCGICRIWETGAEGMPLPEIRKFFARSNRFAWVDVTGGEIFLRDDILDIFATILKECKDLALLHFPTNGYLVDRVVRVTRELIRMRSLRLVITVSVDGPLKIHDRARGTEGSFERALETFARLRTLSGCSTFLGMTLSDANMGAVGATLAAVRRRVPGVTAADLHVNLPNRSGHYYRNDDVPAPLPAALVDELRNIRRRRGVPSTPFEMVERRSLALGERFLRTGRCPIPCQALSAGCFVSAGGVVYPCVTWSRPVATLAECGYDLEALWNTPPVIALRKEIAAGRCPQCWTACEAVPSIAARWGSLRP